MLKNKKGAALLQVLLVTVVLAGMATMLLRASLSRTTTARQTRRTVSGQMLINACMAEINTIWSNKSPEAFAGDLEKCIILCKSGATRNCPAASQERTYSCRPITIEGTTYTVNAVMTNEKKDGRCKLEYEISSNKGDVEF